jgi:hypothetical protein
VPFRLLWTKQAKADLALVGADPKKLKKVRKTLAYLEAGTEAAGMNTHEYYSLEGENKERVFQSYVENQTPAAYRLFWHYGPGKGVRTIIAITQHPD